MIMVVISFALVKFYAFAILYVLIVMQIKLVVVKGITFRTFATLSSFHIPKALFSVTVGRKTPVWLDLRSQISRGKSTFY